MASDLHSLIRGKGSEGVINRKVDCIDITTAAIHLIYSGRVYCKAVIQWCQGFVRGGIEVELGSLRKWLIAHVCSRFLSQKWLKRYHKSSFTVFFMRFFYCLLPFLISPKLA